MISISGYHNVGEYDCTYLKDDRCVEVLETSLWPYAVLENDMLRDRRIITEEEAD